MEITQFLVEITQFDRWRLHSFHCGLKKFHTMSKGRGHRLPLRGVPDGVYEDLGLRARKDSALGAPEPGHHGV